MGHSIWGRAAHTGRTQKCSLCNCIQQSIWVSDGVILEMYRKQPGLISFDFRHRFAGISSAGGKGMGAVFGILQQRFCN